MVEDKMIVSRYNRSVKQAKFFIEEIQKCKNKKRMDVIEEEFELFFDSLMKEDVKTYEKVKILRKKIAEEIILKKTGKRVIIDYF